MTKTKEWRLQIYELPAVEFERGVGGTAQRSAYRSAFSPVEKDTSIDNNHIFFSSSST
jgi:hypothetical protein